MVRPSLSLSLYIATLATTSASASASASESTNTPCIQQYQPPQLRYPPAAVLNSSRPSSHSQQQPCWQPPPSALLWSPWHMTHSTRPAYQQLVNMQSTHYPRFPTETLGSQIDLVSWSTNANDTSDDRITTVFGYFTPVVNNTTTSDDDDDDDDVAVWRYTSTGPLVNVTNLWAILGWGVDSSGVEYRVDYETGYRMAGSDDAATDAPCVNIASRVQGGPSAETYKDIVSGLRAVGREHGDDGFVRLVEELQALRFDARRTDAVEVVCDQACVDNADLVGGS